MTEPAFQQGLLEEAVAALRRDLLAPDGPQSAVVDLLLSVRPLIDA